MQDHKIALIGLCTVALICIFGYAFGVPVSPLPGASVNPSPSYSPYCLNVAGWAPASGVPASGVAVGFYSSTGIVSASGTPVTQLEETDGSFYYLTTFTFSGNNLLTATCAYRFTTQQ